MTGAELRQSNESRLADNLKPDFMKSDAEKAGDSAKHVLDNAASYLPGQSKAGDAVKDGARDPAHGGSGGLGTTGSAFVPSGEQTVGEKIKDAAGQAASYVTPNQSKSTSTDLKDTVTPGHDSSLTPHSRNATAAGEGQGVLGAIGQKVVDAKDAVVGAVSGNGAGSGADREL